jgi:hypothetical protein
MNVSTLHIAKNRKISPYEHLCLLSFARKGYAVNLFTYDCNCSMPDFVAVRDASEIIPEHNVFENAHEKGSFSMFSNLFRYHLLSRIDTTWIDTDVILLADALPSGHFLYGFQDDCRKTVNGAILKAPHSSKAHHSGSVRIGRCRSGPALSHALSGRLARRAGPLCAEVLTGCRCSDKRLLNASPLERNPSPLFAGLPITRPELGKLSGKSPREVGVEEPLQTIPHGRRHLFSRAEIAGVASACCDTPQVPPRIRLLANGQISASAKHSRLLNSGNTYQLRVL